MIIISPSLLSCNFLQLDNEMQAFADMENIWFHLDIMDGHFVPNLTFGHPIIAQLAKIAPHKLDAHLMVTNPGFYIETFKEFSLHNLTFHFESTVHHDRMVHSIKDHFPSVGISLNPSTSVDLIPDYLLQIIDLVLIMSVNPGFGGQKYIPWAQTKVAALNERKKKLKAHFQIQVDGGINAQNAQDLVKNGANNLVAGSYIFQGGPKGYASKVESLRNF